MGVCRFVTGRATTNAPRDVPGVGSERRNEMAFWKRNDALPGELITDNTSDEPRVTTEEINRLYAGSGSSPPLASWQPLLRDRSRANSEWGH